ncbi:predicted protein [Pyrenophora tritici-repentis Pt-1C-BFP]|uniref:Uncharacterized protein n=2 Tax=Pyrenophora tritici-repentis TaxID=45151 RepID=A0A922NI52_9PLEO|nr:uncharacterized protein PTRG_02334 [Pyrenophora tritici-repentis Pt-1C-BFP]EDU44857.1 predicted protein [Pyrenophora tritici-repentis Pt-1C-BFP]KAI1518314.1 hypothetical protein Ptr86124_001442 [Pyrenophora tritici-repentis]
MTEPTSTPTHNHPSQTQGLLREMNTADLQRRPWYAVLLARHHQRKNTAVAPDTDYATDDEEEWLSSDFSYSDSEDEEDEEDEEESESETILLEDSDSKDSMESCHLSCSSTTTPCPNDDDDDDEIVSCHILCSNTHPYALQIHSLSPFPFPFLPPFSLSPSLSSSDDDIWALASPQNNMQTTQHPHRQKPEALIREFEKSVEESLATHVRVSEWRREVHAEMERLRVEQEEEHERLAEGVEHEEGARGWRRWWWWVSVGVIGVGLAGMGWDGRRAWDSEEEYYL